MVVTFESLARKPIENLDKMELAMLTSCQIFKNDSGRANACLKGFFDGSGASAELVADFLDGHVIASKPKVHEVYYDLE